LALDTLEVYQTARMHVTCNSVAKCFRRN